MFDTIFAIVEVKPQRSSSFDKSGKRGNHGRIIMSSGECACIGYRAHHGIAVLRPGEEYKVGRYESIPSKALFMEFLDIGAAIAVLVKLLLAYFVRDLV